MKYSELRGKMRLKYTTVCINKNYNVINNKNTFG